MKFFVLSDKPDVYLGMRLAGMDGAVVEDRNEALDRIREIVAAKEGRGSCSSPVNCGPV